MWTHKKYGTRKYDGTYERDSSGERVFVLTATLKNGKEHRMMFESWQAAKAQGFKYDEN